MKKERWLSINIVSVLVILISLFAFSFYGVNSWFTQSHNDGVEIYVELSDIMLNVYQKIGSQNTLLTPINEEVDASHVILAGAIIPDEQNSLELVLGNDNKGSSPVYVKFSFELYARGIDSDKLIATTISGYTAQTSSSAGFRYSTDGYYYYADATGKAAKLAANSTIDLMSGFEVGYDSLYVNGGLLDLASESLYIVLTIDSSINGSA